MAHAISIDDGETRATPNERLEALKRKSVSAPDFQQELGEGDLNKIMDRDLYEAMKKDVEKFMDALEKVSEPRKLALSLIFDQVTPSRNSLLHLTASSGNLDGQNILHVAAKAGNDFVYWLSIYYRKPDIIEMLVNSKDVDGNTPLHLASMHNHWEVMHFLTKDRGIDLQLRNNDGLTALDLLGRAISIVSGVRRTKDRDVPSLIESSPIEWIKDQVNTSLLVATLLASITFTTGITLPVDIMFLEVFQLFVIASMLAMYISIIAVIVLIWAYHSARPLLLMALVSMSVAFFAAVTVAVSRLTWLGSLVLFVGVLYLVMIVVVLAALVFPSSKSSMRIVVFYYMVVPEFFQLLIFFFY
ncbi:hypothetical protein EUGRSUZ_K00978 [Eucalyptus grandis]|uniref:Uncharacterized protein n=2 Tax=Eucalyptus grandis TaxID=71139 RepID=A0ACC3ITK1_EUCGR|nr:hypothetical protein EUGRSUZ_K00978 [Eucalyptus grandis]